MSEPTCSVIVPARQCAAMLVQSLTAICASTLPRDQWELIAVDDGSTDDTAEVAAQFADLVLSIPDGPRGPAAARNRGAEVARGRFLVFVDADVCIRPGVLAEFVEAFGADTRIAAVFGAYDTEPRAAGLVSQYRNLLHHYVHLINHGDAETFWAGCGAVRRAAFMAVGMFDEKRFPRPQIEDIELGYRLIAHDGRILLRPEIQGTHLKRWTLWRMLTTDFHDRAVPWMLLLLERGDVGGRGTLNVSPTEKLLTALIGLALLGVALAAFRADPRWLLLSLICVVFVVVANLAMLRWFAERRSVAFALAVIPLRLAFYIVSGAGAAWALFLHITGLRRRAAPALGGALP
ncbi:MAG: glycosyltransferase [Gemmatimonadaceae bacterium]